MRQARKQSLSFESALAFEGPSWYTYHPSDENKDAVVGGSQNITLNEILQLSLSFITRGPNYWRQAESDPRQDGETPHASV